MSGEKTEFDPSKIEIPEPDASLILAWQVKDKRVLVIGGGEVALSRVNHLLQANAKITIVAPVFEDVLKYYNELNLFENFIQRKFIKKDLTMYENELTCQKLNEYKQKILDDEEEDDDDGEEVGANENDEELFQIINEYQSQRFQLVLTAIDDHKLSSKIYNYCKLLNLNVNIADKPKICDFYFGSMYRQGFLQIMISSNGKSPRFCNRLKENLIKPILNEIDLNNSIKNLNYLRDNLRNNLLIGENNTEIIKKRMNWNKKITDQFSIKDWSLMNLNDIEKILKFYPNIPNCKTLEELRK
ncbi:lyase activity protein [[Candida] boidinii]|nr:lyase activity protein [[Candida] boidinii]OWB80337.1 lyase activity protein [[Candida] boidinii]